jgi:acyl-CoA synthetase (NDP forming)
MTGLGEVERLIRTARDRGETMLTEMDGYAVLEAVGIPTPERKFVRSAAEAADAARSLSSARLVIKAVSPSIAHKTDVGAVAIADRESVGGVVGEMAHRLGEYDVRGFMLAEHVGHESGPAGELLVGLRWTDEFGPVCTVGVGGIHTEFFAREMPAGLAIVAPGMGDAAVADALGSAAAIRLVTTPMRGRAAKVDLPALVGLVRRLMTLADLMPEYVADCEINPIALSLRGPVAVDVLVQLAAPGSRAPRIVMRPLAKIRNLLEPKSVAVVGVSESLNPGHIILCNLIDEGFDRSRLYVINPGGAEIEGCRCVPDIRSLPEPVDLLVVAVAAAQAPAIVTEAIAERAAESLILIPGGLEEKAGAEEIVAEMRAALAAARESGWRGPVINGGNCLGIRSRPGRYDTMFIPSAKLARSAGPTSPVAIVSQSGAFAIARMSKLARLRPKYVITLGNQSDLTVGDYLTYLKDDSEVRLFVVSVEGFRPLDGSRFLDAAREITASGRTVVLYRGGRTPEGATASSSHTASVAGDYAVTRGLAEAAGVVVAETIEDFDDLVRLFAAFDGRHVAGLRLGAISNAGFECVAMADALGGFELARLSEATTARIASALRRCRIDTVVDVHNPLDLTPMADDLTYEEAVRAVLEDPGVDVAVVGCVPLTGALTTLAPSPGHEEHVWRESSVAARLARCRGDKASVAVVDSGALYDPMADALEANGIPTFRTADRAVRVFERFCRARIRAAASAMCR